MLTSYLFFVLMILLIAGLTSDGRLASAQLVHAGPSFVDNSKWHIASVQWLETNYDSEGKGEVQIDDPEMNLSKKKDIVQIQVSSDSDPTGISLNMTETGITTGTFRGQVPFSVTLESGKLLVTKGDTITVKYRDISLPTPYKPGDGLDIIDRSIIQGNNALTLKQIEGSSIPFPNNGINLVISQNTDDYFPTNKIIRDRISMLNQQGSDIKFSQDEIVKYDGTTIILSKTIRVITTTHAEFISIFGDDRIIEPAQIDNGREKITIGDQYLFDKIISKLATCSSQNIQLFCNDSADELKNLIANKVGTHVITETFVLKNSFTPITPVTYDGNYGNDQNLNLNFPATSSNFGKFVDQQNLIQFANAQSELDLPRITPIKDEHIFLNGFTLGYGFDRDWSYEYSVLDMLPISVNLHIENGLGMGLRIPIQIKWEINTIDEGQQPGKASYSVDYSIDTLDINTAEYQNRLSLGQEFDGKEFKIYLGPKIEFVIKIFDDDFFVQEKSLSPVTIPASDFTPPLGKREPITDYVVSCDIMKTCIDSPIVKVGLQMGVEAGIIGKEITFDSVLGSTGEIKQLAFTDKTEQRIQESLPNAIRAYDEKQQYIDYRIHLGNVKYRSDVDFGPKIILLSEIDPWIFPLNLSTGWIVLPVIQFNEIVFGTHENTEGTFQKYGLVAVPEFGTVVMIVFAFALVGLMLTTRTKHRYLPR